MMKWRKEYQPQPFRYKNTLCIIVGTNKLYVELCVISQLRCACVLFSKVLSFLQGREEFWYQIELQEERHQHQRGKSERRKSKASKENVQAPQPKIAPSRNPFKM